MSETEIIGTHSAGCRQTDTGLIRTRTAFDGVAMGQAYRGIYLKVYCGGRNAKIVLTPDEARHIARCLTRCCDEITPLIKDCKDEGADDDD